MFPGGSEDKASACHVGDPGSIPGLGRAPGEGNGNPLQYSCLENPWTEEPGGLQSTGSQRVGHDWASSCFTFHLLHYPHFTDEETEAPAFTWRRPRKTGKCQDWDLNSGPFKEAIWWLNFSWDGRAESIFRPMQIQKMIPAAGQEMDRYLQGNGLAAPPRPPVSESPGCLLTSGVKPRKV